MTSCSEAGRRGGKKRWKNSTPQQRSDHASKMARARQAKRRKVK